MSTSFFGDYRKAGKLALWRTEIQINILNFLLTVAGVIDLNVKILQIKIALKSGKLK